MGRTEGLWSPQQPRGRRTPARTKPDGVGGRFGRCHRLLRESARDARGPVVRRLRARQGCLAVLSVQAREGRSESRSSGSPTPGRSCSWARSSSTPARIHKDGLDQANRFRALGRRRPNAGCCAGFSLALSCALIRVIVTNLGSARRWRVDRGKGIRFTGPPRADKARADSVDGLWGQGLPARVACGHRLRLNHVMRRGGTPVGRPTRSVGMRLRA
jgi:hypothetical protein